jgi:hypothetical protein
LGNSPLSFDPTRTIPKPFKQHPIKKRSSIPLTYSDLEEKLHKGSNTSSYLRIR